MIVGRSLPAPDRRNMSIRVLVCLCSLVLLSFAMFGQGGIRLILWNYEPLDRGAFSGADHYGIGYDHDLTERTSMAVQARINSGADTWVVNYRSAFHLADNSGPSTYLGPMIGLRRVNLSTDPQTLIPIGFRVGVRGGLERFFADLHAGFVLNMGAGNVKPEAGYPAIPGATYCVGLDLGWGWDAPRDRPY